ncbi:hypothetical protein AJ87_35710 [Rhizobium yanglingense]|nr:hypothetical protein AJ87_35710 [Rhizobium yanglingense]
MPPVSHAAAHCKSSRHVHLGGSRRAFCRVARTEPVENMWQYTWPNRLSNRVFDTYEAIIGAACGAWRRHFAQTTTITCIENEGLGHMSVSRHDRWFCLKTACFFHEDAIWVAVWTLITAAARPLRTCTM